MAEFLRRYKDQETHLAVEQFIKDPIVVTNALSHSENYQIEGLLKQIEKMDSVTKLRQRENATRLELRVMFDSVSFICPQLEEILSDHAPIIHFKVIETALVKMQDGKVIKLHVDDVVSKKSRLPPRKSMPKVTTLQILSKNFQKKKETR